jgi:hypothetical protein
MQEAGFKKTLLFCAEMKIVQQPIDPTDGNEIRT